MNIPVVRTADGWWVQSRTGRLHRVATDADTTAGLLADRLAVKDAAARAAAEPDAGPLAAEAALLSPVTTPCRVVAQMVNYRSHAVDSGFDPDTVPPAFFRKASGSVSGPYQDIVRPPHVRFLDYEVELGLVLGADLPIGTEVSDATLPDYVAALVVANDVSARDLQLPKTQFYESKSYPTFTPLGPRLLLVDAEDLARLTDLRLTLAVNGATRQNSTTEDMIVRPARALTLLARFQTLRPGDVLLTGTPGGTALKSPGKLLATLAALMPPRKRWQAFFARQKRNPNYLQDGDVVAARIATDDGALDLGEQRTVVRALRPLHTCGGRTVTLPRADLLWPAEDGATDLATIEAVPLTERGLPATTYETLLRAADRWPERPALTVLPDAARFLQPATVTFGQLRDQVHRTANLLRALGVTRPSAVGLLSPNTAELPAALLAAQVAGVAAPVNPDLAPEHVEQLLRRAGAWVLIAAGPQLDTRVWATARRVAADLGLEALLALAPTAADGPAPALEPVEGVRVRYLAELAAAHPADRLVGIDPPAAEDLAAYFHTGGTTGTPKLAAHTHANEVVDAWAVAASIPLDQDSVLFGALPLFHVNALIVTLLGPLLRGQQVVWAGPLGYREPQLYGVFWKLVEHYHISTMSGVPTVYAALARVPVDADISSMRFAAVGASPLPPAVRASFEEHTGVPLCEGYGLTEATCASVLGVPGGSRPGAVGRRLPYQRVKTVEVDPNTCEWHDLPPGATGVLAIGGPTVFAGYVAEQTADGARLDSAGNIRDGWLNTGDLGRIDADGFVTLAGRAKDVIIRGGHNIDPAVIEDALLAHPEVTAAAAVGHPDPHAGEVPVAYVTLAPGARVHPRDLVTWTAERVPERAAAPREVIVLDAIPVTAIGKPYKVALRLDATRRAMHAELTALGAGFDPEQIECRAFDGGVLVVLPEPPDEALRQRIAAALDRYALTWGFASQPIT